MNPNLCELCSREEKLTFHHLIPATLHSRKWFVKNYSKEEMKAGAMLCQDCHNAIHRFIPEKLLGTDFNTIEKLRSNEKVAGFVSWVAKRSGQYKTDLPVWHRRG